MAGKTGAARLATLAPDVPVIPVAQWGVQESIDLYAKKVRLFPRPRHVLSVGEPVDLSAFRRPRAHRPHPARDHRCDHAAAAPRRRRVAGGARARPGGCTAGSGPASRRRSRPPSRIRPEGRSVRATVLGAGSWGTTFAKVLADAGNEVTLWARRPELAEQINREHRNGDYLPGIALPSASAGDPRRRRRAGRRRGGGDRHPVPDAAGEPGRLGPARCRPGSRVISLMKGVELGTTKRMSEVIVEVAGHRSRASSPWSPDPTWPARSPANSRRPPSWPASTSSGRWQLQAACTAPYFRPYTNTDVIGCELGGAVKNVIALAAGMANGMGFGDNTVASLITRGLAETARLGAELGADPTHVRRAGRAGRSGGDLLLAAVAQPQLRRATRARRVPRPGPGGHPRPGRRGRQVVPSRAGAGPAPRRRCPDHPGGRGGLLPRHDPGGHAATTDVAIGSQRGLGRVAAMSRIRIAVVYGGRSSEHGISVVSAGSVLAALDPAKYDVVPIGITPDGALGAHRRRPAALRITGREIPEVGEGHRRRAARRPDGRGLGRSRARGRACRCWSRSTWCSRCCTGGSVRTAPFRGCWRWPACPTSGPGCWPAPRRWTRTFAKKLLRAEGLRGGRVRRGAPRAPGVGGGRRAPRAAGVRQTGAGRVERRHHRRSPQWAELPDAVALAFEHDDKVLVEAAVIGREIECGVLEDETASPRPACRPRSDSCAATTGTTSRPSTSTTPASSTSRPSCRPGVTERLQAAAPPGVHRAGLRRAGPGRLLRHRPTARSIVNEVNTMPGFTPISMFPKVWAASGIDYPTLVDRLVTAALRRAGR